MLRLSDVARYTEFLLAAGEGTMDKLRQVREQQETLTRMHFQLYAEQVRVGYVLSFQGRSPQWWYLVL